jgi:hypothetical protein
MTTTTIHPAELYKIQSEINSYVAQKEELYKLLKDTQTGYDIDTSNLSYQFKPVTGLTAQAKKTENLAKYQALQSYFKKNYNENTKMRDYYFKETDKLNIILNEQAAELTELAVLYDSLNTQASTDYRRLKEVKYKLAEQDYYYHLYVVSGLAQLIILAILALVWIKTIPFLTGGILLIVILSCLVAYIVYYIYFKYGERDLVTFDKYRYPIKGDTILNAKSKTKTEAERKAERDIADKVNKMLTDNAGKCAVEQSNP